jgi:transketolase
MSATRFIGYGWNVTRVTDANDLEMLARAFEVFQKNHRPAHSDHRGQPHRLRFPA